MHFEDEIAIVIERYDRLRTPAGIRRVHQEDICQALAILPTHKYQNEGGPGINEIVALLRAHSSEPREDVSTFVDSVAFNWLIGGTDAHAKNYAVLIGAEGRVRLAPLYDVASILPYAQINFKQAKLSMKLGGEYRFSNIQARHWERMARDIRLDPDQVIQRVDSFARHLPDYATDTQRRMMEEGIDHPLLPRLARRLAARAAACQRILR
jgi:serine/threonine-protein kinase HipA